MAPLSVISGERREHGAGREFRDVIFVSKFDSPSQMESVMKHSLVALAAFAALATAQTAGAYSFRPLNTTFTGNNGPINVFLTSGRIYDCLMN
jgi:hypothetical protein